MSNEQNEKVVTGNWVAKIRTRRDRYNSRIRRKVISTGVYRISAPNILRKVKEKLREGYDVRFVDGDGLDQLRLFHCMDTEFTSMFVAAQSMGDLRSCCSDIGFKVVRRDELTADDLRQEYAEMVKEREELADVDEVTPDTMITCPKCGSKFRVGKALTR